jgi:chemotaxis-related protein WspD
MKPDARTPAAVDDCWNSSIGLRGDRSCEKLAEVVHCRNCPTYTDGARAIMQRELPPGYRHEWAAHFAEPELPPRATDRSGLVFRVGGEWLCLPAGLCIAVAEAAPAHSLPHRDRRLLAGIVNVRGKLYPCMSLAVLMGVSDAEAPPAGRRAYPRLIVMRFGSHDFALPVHDVYGIHRYAASDLASPPATVAGTLHRYLTGVLDVGQYKVGCLDAELIGYQFAGALK